MYCWPLVSIGDLFPDLPQIPKLWLINLPGGGGTRGLPDGTGSAFQSCQGVPRCWKVICSLSTSQKTLRRFWEAVLVFHSFLFDEKLEVPFQHLCEALRTPLRHDWKHFQSLTKGQVRPSSEGACAKSAGAEPADKDSPLYMSNNSICGIQMNP